MTIRASSNWPRSWGSSYISISECGCGSRTLFDGRSPEAEWPGAQRTSHQKFHPKAGCGLIRDDHEIAGVLDHDRHHDHIDEQYQGGLDGHTEPV